MIVKVKCDFTYGELLFATQNIQDGGPTAILESGGNWQNKIVSISSLSRNIGEDKSYEISGISIEFDDTDRFFRTMMSGTDRFIVGRKVELFSEEDRLIYTGTVEKWQFSEDAFVLFINDKLSGLDKLIPGVITADQYPNMTEKADGQAIPVIYGDVRDNNSGAVTCWLVDTYEESGETKGYYCLAKHHCKSLEGVFDSEGSGLTLAAFELENIGTAGEEGEEARIKYIGLDTFMDESIRVNVKGRTDGAGELIEDPVEAIKDVISTFGNMTYDSTAMDSAQDVMQNRGYTIAAVIDGQQNLNDVLVTFCFSFDSDFYMGKGNEITLSLLKWTSITPEKRFTEKQIVEFQLDELPEEIRNKVKYQYKYNAADGSYLKEPLYTRQTSVDDWGEFYNRNETLDLRYVADDSAAFDVVQRFVIQRKNPRRLAHLSVPLSEYAGLDISDIIEVSHPGAIDENSRKYQVRRVNVDFAADIVQVEALDITSMTGGMFVLGNRELVKPYDPLDPVDDGTLKRKWSDTDEFSRSYGYLADRTDGYFGNGTDYGKVLY